MMLERFVHSMEAAAMSLCLARLKSIVMVRISDDFVLRESAKSTVSNDEIIESVM